MRPAFLTASGSYLPERVVRNEDLTWFPAEGVPLLEQKTGVRSRHHAAPGEATSDLAVQAARRCLERAGLSAEQVDAVVLSTSSPDRIQPPTASRVQYLLGVRRAFAFDLNAVCAGGLYALRVASALLAEGQSRNVLVIAAELYSRFLNPDDFGTYPYFGDGAGAVLLQSEAPARPCWVVQETALFTDGSGCEVIQIPAGGSMLRAPSADRPGDAYFKMQGKKVFDFAVQRGSEAIADVLRRQQVSVDSLGAVIAHQANINILRELAKRTGVPRERFYVNLDRIGNTASASVLIALDEVLSGSVAPAELHLLLVAFGGGLAWATSLLRRTE
jgi:3-oxoacyl-[acyl-carrier-protein] synthase III